MKSNIQPNESVTSSNDGLIYSISISTDELRELRVINYFLANNIHICLSQDTSKQDKEFELDISDYKNINLICKSLSKQNSREQYIEYMLGHNQEFRHFKYNGKQFAFNSIIVDNKPSAHGTLFYMVTIKHQCVEDLEYLLNNSLKYYHKYCCNSEDSDETYVIYSNDENYWERICSRNKRDLKYIYLPKKQKKDIDEDVENFLKPKTKERYLKAGVLYKRIYLFEGIPGGGKTSLITALASKYDYNIALLSLDPKTTDLKLSKAIQNLPEKCVLVVEDIDGLFVERRAGDNSKNCVTMSGLLNVFDGIATPEGLIVFITTNFKSNLDAALIRPGRVDYVLKFEYIKSHQIKEMYHVFMENSFNDIELNKFVDDFKALNVNISASLLQQYLFKYFDNPVGALENINDIKKIKESCKTRTNANEEGELYM